MYPALFARRPRVSYRRERIDTPDGDFVDIDWVDGPADAPLAVLFHGLEGSSRSHYALHLMQSVAHRGWRGAVMHFRGCGGELNRRPRSYHSGDSAEIGWFLMAMRARFPGAPLFAIGISLGGNALLKWLGEQGDDARRVVTAAAAVSAPVDLMAAGDNLDRGFNLVYVHHFLITMKKKGIAKLAQYPGLFDRGRMLRSRTLREFDDVFTGPLHGYAGTDDYWTRASSKPWLDRIAAPTLIVNAVNDPFLPAHALPRSQELPPAVTADFPATGGHVGFMTGAPPGGWDWLPPRILGFFDDARRKIAP
jgi:predicted alpha/beta-fold hydrolase